MLRKPVLGLLVVFLAAAGVVEVGGDKPLRGKNLWASLRDGMAAPREYFIVGVRGSYVVIDGQWKLVRHARPADAPAELYNVFEDPSEESDLASKHPKIVDDLTGKLNLLPVGEVISSPRPQRRGQARSGGRRGAGGQPGGRGGARGRETEGPETREPHAEAAARN